MASKANIFYVEDDTTLSFVTQDNLEIQGYDVAHFADGPSAIDGFKIGDYDICVLDVMLPGVDGFEVAKEIRKVNSQIPIIFLTAKSMKEDRLLGLRLGADDYMVKPFSIEELILKIEIFLKRKFISNASTKVFNVGKYRFNHANLTLSLEGAKDRKMTQKESDLLKVLLEQKNTVIKREHILEQVWGENDYFLGRSLDVFISRLRKYLSDDDTLSIENIHGVGFRLNG